MDDNVLFKQQKLQPLAQQQPAAPGTPPQTPAVNPPTGSPPSGAPPRSSRSLKRLLFGVLAVVIVTILVIVFFPSYILLIAL